MDDKVRGLRIRRALLIVCSLLLTGASACAPDLHETVGPLVPIPNITGTVLRDGDPIADIKVKLERASDDSLWAEDRTDAAGRFAILLPDTGTFVIRVDGQGSADFDKTTYEFHQATPEAVFDSPALDIDTRGFAIKEPDAGRTEALPSLFEPLQIRWDRSDSIGGRAQVRFYAQNGDAIWFSLRTEDPEVAWNGLMNQGSFRNRFVQPGTYRWRMIVDTSAGVRYTTAYRDVTFTSGVRR